MQDNALIRPYRNTDRDAVLNLLRMNTPAYFSPEEEKDLLHYLDHELETYFVMESAQEIVGCGGINFDEGRTRGTISWDIIHPGFQGRGLGRLLLQHRLDRLKSMNSIRKIIVRTSQHTYRFYEKSGFVLREQVKDYWAPGFDLCYMEYGSEQ